MFGTSLCKNWFSYLNKMCLNWYKLIIQMCWIENPIEFFNSMDLQFANVFIRQSLSWRTAHSHANLAPRPQTDLPLWLDGISFY